MSDEREPQRSLGSKLARFAVVGVANSAIDLAIFALLLHLSVPPLAANVAAWMVAVIFSFLANGFWSFERNVSLVRSFSRFISLGALISLGVSNLSLLVLSGVFGVWPAKIIGIVVAAALNFAAARWSIEGRLLR